MKDAVAIIGMGGRFPGSPNLASYWQTIQAGRVCAAPVPRDRWRHENFYSANGAREANRTYAQKFAAVDDVRSFAPEFFGLSPRRSKVMDPQQRLFLEAVRVAIEDAGYAARPLPRSRTGVFVGATVSDFMDIVTARARAWQLLGGEFGRAPALDAAARTAIAEDLVPMQAYTMVGALLNMVAANVSQVFDFGGPSFTVDAACSSALVALHQAVWQLRTGLCDLAVVGGVYLVFSPDNFVAFSRIGALSPSDACRPYDRRADGFVIGEGVGAVLLRRLEDAQAAGDRIYAVIRGIASNSDGKSEGPMTPRREGQLGALEAAYADAGFPARTVGFLEGHGTATPVGDATEIAAFRDCVGARAADGVDACAVTSVKANIGHTMSAAGIAGLIKATLTLLHRRIPPQAGYAEPRSELELERAGLYVPQSAQDWAAPVHPRRAGVNAFGFGGTNVHVVLEEPPAGPRPRASVAVPAEIGRGEPRPDPSAPAHLILLTAPTPALLGRAAQELAEALPALEPEVGLADVAYTLGRRRRDLARLALVVRTLDELGPQLREAAAALSGAGPLPTGVVHRAAPLAADERKVAFLFPGQGLQTPGMCRDLYDRFPRFRQALDRLAGATPGLPLLSFLYPAEETPEAAAALTATEVCQPAVAALGLALAELVGGLGLTPDVALGHSLGEFAAAAAGGVIADDAACVRFVAERGRIIAASAGPRGVMSAVAADQATAAGALRGLEGVVLANLNHPRQVVLSGTEAAVAEAERRLAASGTRTTRLRVSHAFHSPMMAELAERLAPAVAALPLAAPARAVVSAIRVAPYDGDAGATRKVFLEHATARVDFAGALRVSASLGARLFVQLGAGSALASMATATLREDAPVSLTLAGSTPDGSASFLRAIGELLVAGAPLDLDPLFEGERPRLVSMLPPSLLEARPLWPVAPRDTLSPAAMPEAAEEPMEPKPQSAEIEVPPVEKPPAPSVPPPPADGLSALFQQQIAVLDAHLTIIRQQNDLLSRGTGVPVAAPVASAPIPPPVPAPAPAPTGNGHHDLPAGNGHSPRPVARPAPASNGHQVTERPRSEAPAGPSPADLEAKVIDVVSRITAHPPARLGPGTRLGGDLGFDSLMVVELVSGLQELVPEAEPLARSTFAEDLTIAEVARHLQRSLARTAAGARRAAPRPVRAEEISRYTVAYEPRPIPAAGAALPLPPVVLLADQGGVAEELRRRLERRNVRAQVATAGDLDIAAGATVVDLRALGDGTGLGGLPEASECGARAQAAFALARSLDAGRPATLLYAYRGLAASGLAGLAKSLGREWAASRVLAVEVDAAMSPDRVAEALLAELCGGETAGEVRHTGAERLVPVLRRTPLPAGAALPERAVVVISGGGRGLGARLARALARRCHARIALLGRKPAGADSEALLAEIRAAGGEGLYLECDVRDAAAVDAACARARQTLGPVQLAVHAAGVVEDAPVGRKEAESFARVFDTKVAGALALWRALEADPLAGFLVYGSWAGRFGNAHQADYAAANHLLGRLAEALPAMRAGGRTRVATLDLPPWEGSNMLAAVPDAVRGEMRARGVPFLSDEVGLERVIGELTAVGPSGEALLGGALPPRTVPVALRTRLSVQAQPYLDDHRIGDRPVLPMAAAVDLLLGAARGAGVHADGEVTAVRDLAVVKGVILTEGSADVVARATADEGGSEASVELLTAGRSAGVSYRARVARAPGWLEAVSVGGDSEPIILPLSEFYARHTFHGPRLRAVEEVTGVGAGHIEGLIHVGSAGGGATPWLLAVDGALQLCAYWAVTHHGRIGLPVGVAEMRLRAPIPAGVRLHCRAALAGREGDRFESDLDLFTDDGEPVVQIRGLHSELVVGLESPVVDSGSYRIEEFPEVKELQTKIEFARAAGIDIPYFRTLDACTGATALIEGREYINFTSYNYVGLSGHPRIAEAVTQAVRRYGTSVSASRVTGGQKPIHAELEQELARFLGTESALVMVGGHSTNVSVIGHLLGPEDLVLHDALAHDSILGGAKLAGARRRPFPHNDHQALERILREVRSSVRRVLIAVEGVYSMDGDITPLPPIIAIKKKYGAMLFVDEAHSLGVLGRTGRGVGEHYAVDRRDVDIWMGTMSKTLASCGGYIAGTAVLTEYLKYTVPGFIYSVGMTPANAAAALTALRILVAEPERARACQDRAHHFLRLCRERGIDTGDSDQSSVVPCIVGNSYAAIRLAEGLLRRGIHVHPIIYPAVSETMARLRFFVTAAHSEEQLRITADALADELTRLALLPKVGAGDDQVPLEVAAPHGEREVS